MRSPLSHKFFPLSHYATIAHPMVVRAFGSGGGGYRITSVIQEGFLVLHAGVSFGFELLVPAVKNFEEAVLPFVFP